MRSLSQCLCDLKEKSKCSCNKTTSSSSCPCLRHSCNSLAMGVKRHRVLLVIGFLVGGLIGCLQWNLKASTHLESPSSIRARLNLNAGMGLDGQSLKPPTSDPEEVEVVDYEPLPSEDEEDLELGGNISVEGSDYDFSVNESLVDEAALLWLFEELKLEVRLGCAGSNETIFKDKEDFLVVCLDSEQLKNDVSIGKLSKFRAKLLVLKSVVEKIGGNGTDLMSQGEKAGTHNLRFDELAVSVLEHLMVKMRWSLLKVKAVESTLPPKRFSATIATNTSQVRADLALEKSVDISFLHKGVTGVKDDEDPSQELDENTPFMPIQGQIHLEGTRKGLTINTAYLKLPPALLKQFEEQTKNGGVYIPSQNLHPLSKKSKKVTFISAKLAKLHGCKFAKDRTLKNRGFQEDYSFKSPALLDRVKEITEETGKLPPEKVDVAMKSLDPDILKRGALQRKQLKSFCAKQKSSEYLPNNIFELDILFKHLLYDDKRRIVFCYVPKNGCSNMKRMLLILNGILPKNASQLKRPSESLLGEVNSFRGLSREGALYRLNNYFKYAVVRNPLERLLSGYRNKLGNPMNITMVKKFPNRLKAYILTLLDKKRIASWAKEKNYSRDIHPSFSQTLDFMTMFNLSAYNEHFIPFLQLCHPCAINYDVYLNLKTINYDVFALMDYFKIPSKYYPPVPRSQMTADLLTSYFKDVKEPLKKRFFKKFSRELEFYYKTYPEEADMHLNL